MRKPVEQFAAPGPEGSVEDDCDSEGFYGSGSEAGDGAGWEVALLGWKEL